MSEPTNGRLAEMLHETRAELEGLKERILDRYQALKELVDERDRLYKERDESRRTAVDAALKAAEQQTQHSFEASEKAIVKAENAQREYNVRSNEFRGQLDDQAKRLISRVEVEALINNLEEKMVVADRDLRKLQDAIISGGGLAAGGKAIKDESRSNIAIAIAIGSLLVLAARTFFGGP